MAGHSSFELPDNPPREGPRSTTVHRFSLVKELADHLNLGLLGCIDQLRAAQEEVVRVSNMGQAFHRS